MKAFWWFKHDSIAGMARPGFNTIKWFDLPFQESLVYGWLGQHSVSPISLDSFQNHVKYYAPKIYGFHNLNSESGPQAIEIFSSIPGFLAVLRSLNEKTKIYKDFKVEDNALHFAVNHELIENEIKFLKNNGILHLISLTEKQHHQSLLQKNFSTYHIPINDLSAPTPQQTVELVEIVKRALVKKERLVIHCMAGIGRTSTMILAAHILMGEMLSTLMPILARQNPSFALTAPQEEFLNSLSLKC